MVTVHLLNPQLIILILGGDDGKHTILIKHLPICIPDILTNIWFYDKITQSFLHKSNMDKDCILSNIHDNHNESHHGITYHEGIHNVLIDSYIVYIGDTVSYSRDGHVEFNAIISKINNENQ